MRYSLEELEAAVEERLGSDAINEVIHGYPLLHSLLIEWRDELDEKQFPRWEELLKRLVNSNHVDVDVLSKHGNTPLHSVVDEHEAERVEYLLQLLLSKNANPNLLNRRGQTPLECAISMYPANHANVQILKKATHISGELKKRCQEQLEDAVSNYDAHTINTLIDLRLAEPPSPYVENRTKEPSWFCQGVWLRTVSNPKQEREILDKRKGLSPEQLRGYKAHNADTDAKSDYTNYSPATFVKSAIPVSVFGFNPPGVIIRQACRTIDYWYDGYREELTRNMSFDGDIPLTHGAHATEHEHHQVKEHEMTGLLAKSYEYHTAWTKKKDSDRYAILESRPFYCTMSWNEGLFRYQREDIIGIFVCNKKQDSVEQALQLAEELGLDPETTQFFHYDSDMGMMSAPIPRAVFSISSPRSCRSKFFPDRNQEKNNGTRRPANEFSETKRPQKKKKYSAPSQEMLSAVPDSTTEYKSSPA